MRDGTELDVVSVRSALAIVSLATLSSGQAAELRAEFFARLRDCETAFQHSSEQWANAGSVERVCSGSEKYFAGDHAGTCVELSAAAALVRGWRAEHGLYPDGFGFEVAPKLLDRRDLTLDVSWQTFDGDRSGKLWGATLRVSNGHSADAGLFPTNLGAGVWCTEITVEGEGDFDCRCTLGSEFEIFARSVTLSVVERRDERLTALESAIVDACERGPRLEVETARMLSGLLRSLASGSTEAHEYPGARLLAEAEHVVAVAAQGERWYGPERDGEFWLALPVGERSVRTRVFVPSGLSRERSAPLVLALHGRSFDEDTWFDGYGCGQSVELARKRGWLFAAPRCDGREDAAKLGAIVTALAQVYPLDQGRVLLVGHSRGGGSALAALAESPSTFRATATIGSSLAPDRAAALAGSPLFLAAGDRDFARKGVEAFHASLVEASATSATLKIYPHTEHWLAVTAAMPDVFACFDAHTR
jgi:pimeloyl-ACP methyl ester carboxylesterase